MNSIGSSKILPDIKLFSSTQHSDPRGVFRKPFFSENLSKNIDEVREVIVSTSHKNVIRGLHFQIPPRGLAKLITCIEGEVKDVFVDLRKKSSTYLKHDYVILSQDNNKSVLIPEGFAHGFSVLSEKASVLYLQSKDYSEVHDKGINPLSLDIDWGLEDYIISKKDEMLPSITEFDSPW